MPSSHIKVTFEMTNGSILSCEFVQYVIPGYTSGLPEDCYPDEVECDEACYFIDEDEVKYADLPKGLHTIADAMYYSSESDKRFKFHSVEL